MRSSPSPALRAWPTDPAGASRGAAVNVATILPALPGYPHPTVPMGSANGLPVGLSYLGTAWEEADFLAMGYACEQAAPRRPPVRLRSTASLPLLGLLRPLNDVARFTVAESI